MTHILMGLVALLLLSGQAEAAGNEERCDEMGANCVCSNPLNSSSYTEVTSAYWGESSVTTKHCSLEGIAGTVFDIPGGAPFGDAWQIATTGEAINNLPAGHSKTNVLRHVEGGHADFAGHKFDSLTQHIAARWYHYYSTNHVFNNEGGGCNNSGKFMQINRAPIGQHNGSPHFYGWGEDWTPNGIACCIVGPSAIKDTIYQEGNSWMKGKWLRFEAHIINPNPNSGQPRIYVYRKNVTDNTAEQLIIDTAVPTTQPADDNWTSALATGAEPIADLDQIAINTFREGTCAGWQAVSNYLAAAWDTDEGQRIGAAVEIEGAGSPGSSGSSLRITGNVRTSGGVRFQ